MSRKSCVETVESDDGCGCCTISTTPIGWVSRYEYALNYGGHKYYGEATVTSTISQEDADLQAYLSAAQSAFSQAGLFMLITDDGFQLVTDDNYSLAA